jgi:hypothetical protein
MHMSHTVALAALISIQSSVCQAEPELRISVSAGSHHRQDAIVSMDLPRESAGFNCLRDSDGNSVALQIDENGRAVFILKELSAGAAKEFVLTRGASGLVEGITAARAGTKLRIADGDRQMLEYQAEPGVLPRPEIDPIYTRGGYIHPVLTPGGKAVTDDFPPNHIHQHGIWFAWTRTEFQGRQPDFWNMGQGKGRIEFAGMDKTWSGPVHAGFNAQHRFVDLTAGEPRTVLNEKWETRAYRLGSGSSHFVFDLTSTQECAGPVPLVLPDYYYGGLGVRGNWLWNGPGKAFFLTSEGVTNRVAGNQTRGRWCYMGGMIDGQLAGIAILGHPENFRAPQPMRLHPNEPFFCFAPSQAGDWEIAPGQKYISRYRFVVFDGPPDRTKLDRLWHDYAHPPEARLKK